MRRRRRLQSGCKTGTISCTTGTPVCTNLTGNVGAGINCGGNNYCDGAGNCNCTAGRRVLDEQRVRVRARTRARRGPRCARPSRRRPSGARAVAATTTATARATAAAWRAVPARPTAAARPGPSRARRAPPRGQVCSGLAKVTASTACSGSGGANSCDTSGNCSCAAGGACSTNSGCTRPAPTRARLGTPTCTASLVTHPGTSCGGNNYCGTGGAQLRRERRLLGQRRVQRPGPSRAPRPPARVSPGVHEPVEEWRAARPARGRAGPTPAIRPGGCTCAAGGSCSLNGGCETGTYSCSTSSNPGVAVCQGLTTHVGGSCTPASGNANSMRPERKLHLPGRRRLLEQRRVLGRRERRRARRGRPCARSASRTRGRARPARWAPPLSATATASAARSSSRTRARSSRSPCPRGSAR